MPNEITPATGIGRDDLRDVAFQPHHIRGLQAEVGAVVSECLQELDNVCELLRELQPLVVGSAAAVPETSRPDVPGRQDWTAPASTSTTSTSIPPACRPTGDASDFDARLANLKRLLAEKLTEHEPTL